MKKESSAKKPKAVKDVPPTPTASAPEIVSLDEALTESKITLEESQEDSIRTSVYEGIYASITPKKISHEAGVTVFELPFHLKNPVYNKTITLLTINDVSSEVSVTTHMEATGTINGEPLVAAEVSPEVSVTAHTDTVTDAGSETPIVEASVAKIVKKDYSNAVRIAVVSHMGKLLTWSSGKHNSEVKTLTDLHDLEVAKYFAASKKTDDILHYKNLYEPVYQKSKGLSNSQLNKIADSFAHYRLSKITPMAVSSPMLMGRALHCLLFTPELFDSQFIVNKSEVSGASNEGKFINGFFDLISVGREVLSNKEYQTVVNGKESFMKHPVAPFLLKEAEFEESFYTMIEDFLFRGRIDCYIVSPSKELREILSGDITINENEAIVLDLKFTYDNNDNEDQYASAIIRSGYHRQGAAYCSLIERKFNKKCVFILMTVESSAPHDVTLFALDEAFMEIGEIDVTRLLTKYKAHLDNPKLYEGRHPGVKIISAPHWYIQKFGAIHGDS